MSGGSLTPLLGSTPSQRLSSNHVSGARLDHFCTVKSSVNVFVRSFVSPMHLSDHHYVSDSASVFLYVLPSGTLSQAVSGLEFAQLFAVFGEHCWWQKPLHVSLRW